MACIYCCLSRNRIFFIHYSLNSFGDSNVIVDELIANIVLIQVSFFRLSKIYPQLRCADGSPPGTIFTEVLDSSSSTFKWRVDRPALVVSGCSWTPDDDFTIMLEALDLYNATVASSPNIHFHKLICIVTGKRIFLRTDVCVEHLLVGFPQSILLTPLF